MLVYRSLNVLSLNEGIGVYGEIFNVLLLNNDGWQNLIHDKVQHAMLICRSPVCHDILGCHGDQVRLAVRVRVYPYPEDICAVWVMFAVKYRSIL